MKNKLFFSSLIIISMVFSGLNVSLADGNNTLSSDDMTFSIPSMTTIEADSSSVLSTSATPTNKNTLTLNTPLVAKFNVSTLEPDEIIVAVQTASPIDTNSRYSYNGGYIVFTKADGSTTSSAVDNALAYNSSVNDNSNAIAFGMSCKTNDNDYGFFFGDTESIYEYLGSAFGITGEKEITCTISSNSITDTFGMNDTPGNYTATITLTQIAGWMYHFD